MNPRDPRSPRIPRRRLPEAAALAALLILSRVALAQSPEASAFADPNSPFNEPDPGKEWASRDRFDRVRFMDLFSTHFILTPERQKPPLFRFYPPAPPLLDSELPVVAPLDPGVPAPEALSGFVAETFYPALASRLIINDLPREMRQRLVSYHDAKIALTQQLRSRILALKDSDPNERARRLASLAAEEERPIADLAATAEKIRDDLRERNLLGVAEDPRPPALTGDRIIHSVAQTPGDPAGLLKESASILEAAFFQDGLAPAQRKLLFEAALELREKALPAAGQEQPGTRVLSFSPWTARMRIPLSLGEPMESKIREFAAAKDELKNELRDALHAGQEAGGSPAPSVMAALAAAQSDRITRVQEIAEDIRSGMSLLPNPPGPPGPRSLPPELASRISDYRAHKVRLLRALRAMLAAPTPTAQPAQARPTEDPASNSLSWMHDGTTSSEVRSSGLTVSTAKFDRTQSDLITQLNREQADIRASLAEYVRSTNGPADRKSINDLLRDFEEARSREEIWDKYKDYQMAVLMPGLSAAQRQLLFDTAIGELGLPLPTGERIR